MAKFISCGKYNNYYKYILLASFFRIISGILFGIGCPIQIVRLYPEETEKIQKALYIHIIIHNIYRNLGIIIISIIFSCYENYSLKTQKNEEKNKNRGIELIYENTMEELKQKAILNIFFVIILFNIQDILTPLYYQFDLKEFDFWTLELPIFAFFNYRLLKIKIYNHHKCVMYVCVTICLIVKIIDLFVHIFSDDYKDKIYNKHKFLYVIGIFFYLIIISIRAYSVTKIKDFTDNRYISPTKILKIIGIIGIAINIIIALIFSFNKCATVNDIDIHLCNVVDIVDNNNRDESYLENFFIYFKILNNSIKIGRYYEVIIEVFTSFFGILAYTFYLYFYIVMVKFLSSIHTIFCNCIITFSIRVISLLLSFIISDSSSDENTFNIFFILITISDFVYFFGICIYTEIIELHFCNFQYNLRRNIIKRSEEELNINRKSEVTYNINAEENDDDSENNNSLSITILAKKNK